MVEAEPVIRTVLPDANVPTSIRRGGAPVVHGRVSDLACIVESWLTQHADGSACIIGAGDSSAVALPSSRVRSLTPELSKGMEVDLVVLVDPETVGDRGVGAVDRYVAIARAEQELVILRSHGGAPRFCGSTGTPILSTSP